MGRLTVGVVCKHLEQGVYSNRILTRQHLRLRATAGSRYIDHRACLVACGDGSTAQYYIHARASKTEGAAKTPS